MIIRLPQPQITSWSLVGENNWNFNILFPRSQDGDGAVAGVIYIQANGKPWGRQITPLPAFRHL